MSGGTFNVDRSIWDHPEFAPSEFSEREAFLWLISEAAWKPRRVRVGRVVVDLERGQLCASVRFIAEAWMWSKSRVDRFLKRLKNRDMIGTDSGTGQLVITICNYSKFQGGRDTSGTRAGRNPGHERDTSGTNEKKGKKEKKEEREDPDGSSMASAPTFAVFGAPETPKPPPKHRASSLPEGWVPSEKNVADAMDRNFTDQEIADEADRFRDYHLAKGSTFKCWDAAWRTWLGNARKFGNRSVAIGQASAGRGQPVSLAGIAARRRAAAGY